MHNYTLFRQLEGISGIVWISEFLVGVFYLMHTLNIISGRKQTLVHQFQSEHIDSGIIKLAIKKIIVP